MKNTMGLILTGGRNNSLKDLSSIRSRSAIPVGGKYRAVDFVLSNMVNSGLTNIGILTQYNYRSLMDHLGSGKEWDLDRRNDGLFIFPPSLFEDGSGWYKGTADAMYNNLTFLKRSNEEYIIVAQGSCIYKMLYDDLLKFHINKGADMTIVYREMYDFKDDELPSLGIVELDSDYRVLDLQEKPPHPKSNIGSMGIYLLKRQLLIDLIEESVAHGNYDFVKDVIIKKLTELNIYGFKFDGYWRNISSIPSYYRTNMELLNPQTAKEVFLDNGGVYTKVKDEAPAKFNPEAIVRNSIIADGCIIEGTVENSVLFRGVTVKKGAVVKDSIVMQGSVMEEDTKIECAILDKSVVVRRGKELKGNESWPMIVGKNVIV